MKEGLQHDSLAKTIINLVKKGKTTRVWLEDGLILTKANTFMFLHLTTSRGKS